VEAKVMQNRTSQNARMLAKTTTYWVCYISVASTLAYLLTGNLHAALGIGLLEPSVQAGVFLIHEQIWEKPLLNRKG
jgi:uncharacterized membrane protein